MAQENLTKVWSGRESSSQGGLGASALAVLCLRCPRRDVKCAARDVNLEPEARSWLDARI